MSDKQEINPYLAIFAALLFVATVAMTYLLVFGRHSYHYTSKPFTDFSHTNRPPKDGGPSDSSGTAGPLAAGGDAGMDDYSPLTHRQIQAPRDGFIYHNQETVTVVLPANRFSPVAAVRDSNFTWDDSPYYKAHTAVMPPMAKPEIDKFIEEKLLTRLDDIDFNQEIAPLMRRAASDPSIKNAADLINRGRYDEAFKILRSIAQTTDNIFLKSLAVSNLANLYMLSGDAAQQKKAEASLAVINTQLYLKTFPDKTNALKNISAMARDAVKRFENDRPYVGFKPPNKDF